MDLIPTSAINDISAVAVVVAVAIAVITDKLVWHTRLKKALERAEKWENIAIDALTIGAQAGVKAAEVAVDVVSAIPDPARQQGD